MRPIPQRNQLFDLHMHSDRSDGRFSPEEVLERAVEGGLQVVALTDHDLIGAVDPGLHRIGTRDLHVLAGAEISGTHDGREFHLLVYFPGEPPAGFVDFCSDQVKARARRYDAAVHNIALPGVASSPESAAAWCLCRKWVPLTSCLRYSLRPNSRCTMVLLLQRSTSCGSMRAWFRFRLTMLQSVHG